VGRAAVDDSKVVPGEARQCRRACRGAGGLSHNRCHKRPPSQLALAISAPGAMPRHRGPTCRRPAQVDDFCCNRRLSVFPPRAPHHKSSRPERLHGCKRLNRTIGPTILVFQKTNRLDMPWMDCKRADAVTKPERQAADSSFVA